MTNKIAYLIIALAVVLLPELSFALPDPIDPIPEPNTSLSEQLCDLREMFCGLGGGALLTVAVIMVGLAVLSGKIHWSFVVTIFSAAVIFFNADWIADMFISGVVMCSCV